MSTARVNNETPMSSKESILPDGAELSAEQLEAVTAGFRIVESGGVFEVLNDDHVVVFTADNFHDAWVFCEANGGRDRR